MMLVVGLTGSIGMGKSTAAAHFRAHGIPVFDADAEVHSLYAGPAAPSVERAFPGTTTDGVVDREKLARALRSDAEAFKRLEAIVHPLVRAAERDFLDRAAREGASMAVLEIPLLFETGADAMVDAVIVVSASAEAQRRRVLERPGMTAERLDSLLERQMPDDEKRRRADFVVDTSGEPSQSLAQLDAIIEKLKQTPARALQMYWR